VICSECLKSLTAAKSTRGRGARRVLPIVLAGVGLMIAWLWFYAIGRTLLLIPASVHDGTVWKAK